MPRKLRTCYLGATYHIMERGIHRQNIFSDDFDYQVFLTLLANALQKYGCTLHAYCLMTNHFHLLVETSDIEIGKFVKLLANCYAQYYNRQHSFSGHLFEGRYKSGLVQDDAYFLQTSRYIHLNPVKARMVHYPEDYPWSSYRTLLRLNDDKITCTEKTFSYFQPNPVQQYRIFTEDIGKKFSVSENRIQKEIGVNEDISVKDLSSYGFIGELSLDGHLRSCRSILPMVISARKSGIQKLIVPAGNIEEAKLAEYSRRTLDALRQPVEDKKVSISRVNGTHTFPSSFMFITAMNPCPCGYYPSSKSGTLITADYAYKYHREVTILKGDR